MNKKTLIHNLKEQIHKDRKSGLISELEYKYVKSSYKTNEGLTRNPSHSKPKSVESFILSRRHRVESISASPDLMEVKAVRPILPDFQKIKSMTPDAMIDFIQPIFHPFKPEEAEAPEFLHVCTHFE